MVPRVPRVLIASFALLFGSSETLASLSDELVSYWNFDSTLNDVWFSNDGTYVGTDPLTYSDGKFRSAIDLSGDTGRNYVEIPADPSLNLETENGVGNISISAWFKVDSFSKNWQALIAKGEGSSWRIARRDDGNVLSYAGGSADIPTDNATGPNIADGQWHHVVAISEQGVSTRLWIDGQLVATGAPPILSVPPSGNQTIRIGDNPDTEDRSWDGKIDDVAIWGRPLTRREIAYLASGSEPLDPFGHALAFRSDFNFSRTVDDADLAVWESGFGSPGGPAQGDATGDGSISGNDFLVWQREYGSVALTSPNGSAVPEPTSVYCGLMGVLAGAGCWVSRRFPIAAR